MEAESATFTISAAPDELQEADETMVVTLTDATTEKGRVTLGSETKASTVIKSADTFLVSVSHVTVAENVQAGSVTFSVTLEVPNGVTLNDPVTVGYRTVPGIALRRARITRLPIRTQWCS